MSQKTIYFAGALFCSKDLVGNALLTREIHNLSDNRYLCMLPQNREQRETTALAIRNQDILMVATSDLGLFHFDGTELDSGTVVEYMVAKFLDIPSVIIRTDFRKAGDDENFPWNLMASNFPRTKVIALDAMASYQAPLRKFNLPDSKLVEVAEAGVSAAIESTKEIATKIVAAFDQVVTEAPLLSGVNLSKTFEWVSKMVGGNFDKLLTEDLIKEITLRRNN